jgi:hypothetical protein
VTLHSFLQILTFHSKVKQLGIDVLDTLGDHINLLFSQRDSSTAPRHWDSSECLVLRHLHIDGCDRKPITGVAQSADGRQLLGLYAGPALVILPHHSLAGMHHHHLSYENVSVCLSLPTQRHSIMSALS